MSSAATKRLVYKGPAQQVCYALSEYGYSAVLVPEQVYELPAEFADLLFRSNANFQVAPVVGFSFTKEPPVGLTDSTSATSSEQENH